MPVIMSLVSAPKSGGAPYCIDQAFQTISVAVGGASAALTSGGIVSLFNSEASPVRVAWGSTPNTATTTKTAASSAYYVIPAGSYAESPIWFTAGDALAVAAL